MTKIPRKVEYALIALKHLGRSAPEAWVSASEIADAYAVPAELNARVLQTLARGGLLRSGAGVRGGYRLARPLNAVSFWELLQIIEGPTKLARCLEADGGSRPCEVFSRCNIISPMQALNGRLMLFYQQLSLADLLGVEAPALRALDQVSGGHL